MKDKKEQITQNYVSSKWDPCFCSFYNVFSFRRILETEGDRTFLSAAHVFSLQLKEEKFNKMTRFVCNKFLSCQQEDTKQQQQNILIRIKQGQFLPNITQKKMLHWLRQISDKFHARWKKINCRSEPNVHQAMYTGLWR